jgi:Ran GTPase-activating protein (RanGAP) involved in mRNA processing and transport
MMTIQTQTLTTLNLEGNKIGTEGARHLAVALRNNSVSDIFYPFAAFSS